MAISMKRNLLLHSPFRFLTGVLMEHNLCNGNVTDRTWDHALRENSAFVKNTSINEHANEPGSSSSRQLPSAFNSSMDAVTLHI